MYPAVRPGDVLSVRSCRPDDVMIGDIAVCRRPGYLFGHRVIRLAEQDGRLCVVTRPDRSRGGDDGPTFEEDLLGVVVSIRRDGAEVTLDPTSSSRIVGFYHDARVAVAEARLSSRLRVVGALGRLHHLGLYQRLARLCFARALSRARLVVRVPVNEALGGSVFREMGPGVFDPEDTWNGRSPDRWTVVALIGDKKPVAGSIEVLRVSARGWQVRDAAVRVRYGGTGLDEVLRRAAATIVDRSGRHPKDD